MAQTGYLLIFISFTLCLFLFSYKLFEMLYRHFKTAEKEKRADPIIIKIKDILSSNEDEKIDSSSDAFRFFFSKALAFSLEGKHDEAIKLYTLAVNSNLQFSAAYHNRGASELLLNRAPEAFHDFDQVIKLDPKNAKAFYGRGVAGYHLERYEQAIEDYKRQSALILCLLRRTTIEASPIF